MRNDLALAGVRRTAAAARPGDQARGRAARGHGRPILIAVAVSVIAVGALMRVAGLSMAPWNDGSRPFAVAGGIALVMRLGAGHLPWRHGRALADTAEYYGLFTVIALSGAVASYPVAALSHGFHDATLQRIDALIGFDWLAWYRTVAAHASLQMAGLSAYRSIYATPAILLAFCAWRNDRAAAQRLIATFWLAAVITLILYSFMPAVGPFSAFWRGPIPYMPDSERWQQGLIPALRDHSLRTVDLGHLRGIVSAPSFHTAAAVVYIRAAWPLRPLRWPVTGLNLAMLVATPVEGTHYLVDMLLGGIVAGVAIIVMDRLIPAPAPVPQRPPA